MRLRLRRAVEAIVIVLMTAAAAAAQDSAETLGMRHYVAGRLAEAFPYLEEALAQKADDKIAYALARAYALTRQPDKARGAIARTFQVAPDSAPAYLLTGQMLN